MTALGTVIGRGLLSARPAASVAGALYYATDTSTLYRDNASSWDTLVTSAAAAVDPSVCNGRLTLTSGTAITTSGVTAATSVYFTPYKGSRISTYDGAAWSTSSFTEKTLSLAGLTADKNYDIFIVDGTLALEGLVWTNDTTRATALVLQDGIWCKTGALTRRYLGTIRITSAGGQCEDSVTKRYVWNYHNRVRRLFEVFDATDNWTYATATWRQTRATAGNKVEYVCGVSEDLVDAETSVGFDAGITGSPRGTSGVGVDSTSVNSARVYPEIGFSGTSPTGGALFARSAYSGYPGAGYHYLAWLERVRNGTVTWYGDNGQDMQSGLVGGLLA